MTEENDPLRYDIWIEDALRTVIQRTLSYVAEHGLPGEHHFYITFRTADEGVDMPDYLRAEHPEEMTIVLQYQYDFLEVDDKAVHAGLRFNGKSESLTIPLPSIVSFADPSVNFGLQLKMAALDDDDMEFEVDLDPDGEDLAGQLDYDADAEGQDNDKNEPRATGEVIALDAFRKK